MNLVPRPARSRSPCGRPLRDPARGARVRDRDPATGPSAVELMDKYILDLTRRSLEYARQMTFVQGDPGALLFVEFYGETPAELAAKLDPLEAHLPTARIGTAFTRALTPASSNGSGRSARRGWGSSWA